MQKKYEKNEPMEEEVRERKRKSRFDIQPNETVSSRLQVSPALSILQDVYIQQVLNGTVGESYISVTDHAFKAKLEKALDKNFSYIEKLVDSAELLLRIIIDGVMFL